KKPFGNTKPFNLLMVKIWLIKERFGICEHFVQVASKSCMAVVGSAIAECCFLIVRIAELLAV
ncbi:hypothetical protein MUP77_16530, partial [Candidatus Bathyarchaeota archaeon]|nr:hypothetical protein [Candidatus Bathyarchaeota archaeon]